MKQIYEYLIYLRFKLQITEIPCEGAAYILIDNQSFLANTSVPDSTLKKKCQSIGYNLVREGIARDEWRKDYV